MPKLHTSDLWENLSSDIDSGAYLKKIIKRLTNMSCNWPKMKSWKGACFKWDLKPHVTCSDYIFQHKNMFGKVCEIFLSFGTRKWGFPLAVWHGNILYPLEWSWWGRSRRSSPECRWQREYSGQLDPGEHIACFANTPSPIKKSLSVSQSGIPTHLSLYSK